MCPVVSGGVDVDVQVAGVALEPEVELPRRTTAPILEDRRPSRPVVGVNPGRARDGGRRLGVVLNQYKTAGTVQFQDIAALAIGGDRGVALQHAVVAADTVGCIRIECVPSQQPRADTLNEQYGRRHRDAGRRVVVCCNGKEDVLANCYIACVHELAPAIAVVRVVDQKVVERIECFVTVGVVVEGHGFDMAAVIVIIHVNGRQLERTADDHGIAIGRKRLDRWRRIEQTHCIGDHRPVGLVCNFNGHLAVGHVDRIQVMPPRLAVIERIGRHLLVDGDGHDLFRAVVDRKRSVSRQIGPGRPGDVHSVRRVQQSGERPTGAVFSHFRQVLAVCSFVTVS